MNIKNCAVYTRVSTDNQAEKEFSSCEAQEQKIKSFIASQNDWQVFKVYNDAGFSGAILERPALQELLSDLKKKLMWFWSTKLIGSLVRQKIFTNSLNFLSKQKLILFLLRKDLTLPRPPEGCFATLCSLFRSLKES